MDFIVQIGGRTLLEYLGAIRCFLIDRKTASSSTTTQDAKGKHGFFFVSQASE